MYQDFIRASKSLAAATTTAYAAAKHMLFAFTEIYTHNKPKVFNQIKSPFETLDL
jgi:hypothetical protein